MGQIIVTNYSMFNRDKFVEKHTFSEKLDVDNFEPGILFDISKLDMSSAVKASDTLINCIDYNTLKMYLFNNIIKNYEISQMTDFEPDMTGDILQIELDYNRENNKDNLEYSKIVFTYVEEENTL